MAKAKWSKEISKELFIEQFEKLKSVKEMSIYWGVDRATIRSYSKKIDYSYRTLIPQHNFKMTDESLEYIRSQYYTKSALELSKEFNVSKSYIIKVWRDSELRGKPKKPSTYTFNENYFETIDSKDKAYFLGMLTSDGCVYKRNNNIGQSMIKLSLTGDIDVLEKFKKCLNSNHKISKVANKNKDNHVYTITLISDKMALDLEKYGVVRNKTDKAIFPKISSEFVKDYIRGLFDGDGSIYSVRQKRNKDATKQYSHEINFVGTYKVIQGVSIYLSLNSIEYKINEDKRDYSFPFYSLRVKKQISVFNFINYIYHDCEGYYMIRKKTKADEVLENLRCRFK